MSKHTPGPWEVTGPNTCEVITSNTGTYKPIRTIAKVNGYWDGEVLANMRLIAAAPELLEALKAASEWLNDMGCEHEEPDLRCVVCLVNAAINKAEGR